MSERGFYQHSLISTLSDHCGRSSASDTDDTKYGQSANEVALEESEINDIHSQEADFEYGSELDGKGRKKSSGRWEECLKKRAQSHSISSQSGRWPIARATEDQILVREFLPQSANDPVFSVLREIFLRSFEQFYADIETRFKLTPIQTRNQYLDETFDAMEVEIFNKTCRCFMICLSDTIHTSNTLGVVGFLTLKEVYRRSVYITQCAIEPSKKYQGYGTRLVQHLRTIYPRGTTYWGFCRRANAPAINFYVKQGALFMDDKEVAKTYGYDSALYVGLRYTDLLDNSELSSRPVNDLTPPTPAQQANPPTPPEAAHTACQEPTPTDTLITPKKKQKKKRSCCVIS